MDDVTFTQADPELISALADIVGADNILTDDATRAYYSQDVYDVADPVAAVIRPGDKQELARAVGCITGAGYDAIPRGGGMSYTSGYLPIHRGSVMVDLGRLNRILEINAEDMYITVEAGCTWHTIREATKDLGVRPAMWGPLSGQRATVGGGLSQISMFFGSGQHGTTADIALSLDVVLADGTIVTTGSAAQKNAKPFYRNYGPDLTGLFLGDTGAMGIKAQATLRLVRTPAAQRYLSLAFDEYPQMLRTMSEIARAGVASECFGMDPALQRQRMQRASIQQDLKALKGVVSSGGSLMSGLKDAAKVAVTGRRFMDDVRYSVHYIIEGIDDASADAAFGVALAIGKKEGREIEPAIPRVLHGTPFMEMTSMVGPQGERWVPTHGVMPHSLAVPIMDAIDALWRETAEDCARLDITVGHLFTSIRNNAIIIEPVFYWPEPRHRLIDDVLGPVFVSKLKNFPPNPEARAFVIYLRKRLCDILRDMGAIHFQIGKAYPYEAGLKAESWRLLNSVKDMLDPGRHINPGSLGLK